MSNTYVIIITVNDQMAQYFLEKMYHFVTTYKFILLNQS